MKYELKTNNKFELLIGEEKNWLTYQFCSNKKYVTYEFYENGFLFTLSNSKKKHFCYKFNPNTTVHTIPNRVRSMYHFTKKMTAYLIKNDVIFVPAVPLMTVLYPEPAIVQNVKKMDDEYLEKFSFETYVTSNGLISFRNVFPVEDILGKNCLVTIYNNGMKRIELTPVKHPDKYEDYNALIWEYGHFLQHCCADKVSFVRKTSRQMAIPQFFLKACNIDPKTKTITCYRYENERKIVIAPSEVKDFCTGKTLVPANEPVKELPICNECAKITPLNFQKAYTMLEESNMKIAELEEKYEKILASIQRKKIKEEDEEFQKAKEVLDIIGTLQTALS